ncbi:hypothetical protein pb186bvf_002389 [Paramecium bursaria]
MGNCVSSNGEDIRKSNQIQPLSVTVKHFTWNKDSHGLFDYENKNIVKGQIKTNSAIVKMIRQKEAIKIVQTSEEAKAILHQDDVTDLIKLHKKQQKYLLEYAHKQQFEEDQEGLQDSCAWIVVKTVKGKFSDSGYDLKEGDYIKLGRVRFRIREIRISDGDNVPELSKFVSQSQLQIMVIGEQTVIDDDQKSQAELPSCRICYNDADTTEDNPLVDCCKCQGSMKYIHIKCLRQWLRERFQPKTTKFSVSFQWKQFECEVCKAIIPNIIKKGKKVLETVEIPKPQKPYIALEILSREKNQSKGTHIISFAQKNQIKLGRGQDSDVRITDISVSRCHALIKFQNGGFVIEDQKSKFGTLVLMKGATPLSVDQNNNIAIQIGRSVISFHLTREWQVQSCCIGPATEYNTIHEDHDIIGGAEADEDQNLESEMLPEEDASPQ